MFEAYSVSVRVTLINGVNAGLQSMSRQFKVAGVDAALLQKRLDGIRKTMLIGGGLTVVGLGMFAMLKPALEEAKKFQQETAKFAAFGMGDSVNAQAVRFAKSANLMGTSYVDAMHRMTEAQGVFRKSGALNPAEQLAGAKLAMPMLSKIAFANSVLSPEQAGARDAAAMSMLRFVEMRGGLQSPAKFNSIADSGFKAIQSGGGNVSWDLYRQFMATAGVSARLMSDRALFGQMEPIIGELKSGAGVGYMTSYNRLTGVTRVPNQVAHELVNYGLWDNSKILWNSQGGIKRMLGNPLRDLNSFSISQPDWYLKNVMPMYAKRHLSEAEMDREDALIGGRSGGKMYSLIRRQQTAIENSVMAWQKALGVDQAYKLAGTTALGKQLELQKKLKDLEEETGEVVLPIFVAALSAALPPLRKISNFARDHPKIFGGIVDGFMVLGGMLVASGIITGLVGLKSAFGLVFNLFKVGGAATSFATKAPIVARGITAVVGAFEGVSVTALAAAGVAIAGVVGLSMALLSGLGRAYAMSKAADPHFGLHSLFPSADDVRGPAQGSRFVAGGGGGGIHTVNLNLDGKKIAHVTIKQMQALANGPSKSAAKFDDRQAYMPLGAGRMY